MQGTFQLTIAIPAYGRPNELEQLLASISTQYVMPNEILVCEDCSLARDKITAICSLWKPLFAKKGCNLRCEENEFNLGYDGNIRKLFEKASGQWVLLIGDDDILLPECVKEVRLAIEKNSDLTCFSRSFYRFNRSPYNKIGESRLNQEDCVYTCADSDPKMIFRSCGFVGGLVFQKDWVLSKSTSEFDGTLYYQIYLACEAYCGSGIGYISTPIVAGRAGNAPLFGKAENESDSHTPGEYTPRARAKMWESVIRIARQVGAKNKIDLEHPIRRELAGRQSFHVFEIFATAGRNKNRELKKELCYLGLYRGLIPRMLYLINVLLGQSSIYIYRFTRCVFQ